LKAEHAAKKRRVEVLPGDFNVNVHAILRDGSIKESTATFALLDQRTFECAWDTVIALGRHKKETKIEIFYFFATGWIDRSLGALKRDVTKAKVRRWWGRDDYAVLQGMDSTVRAKLVARRFEEELGYKKATVYPIHSERRRGRVMYHMIHATDHPEATPFMIRAYRKVSGRSDLEPEQIDIEEFLKKLDTDSD
jgi:three-Cys-motif partner protein